MKPKKKGRAFLLLLSLLSTNLSAEKKINLEPTAVLKNGQHRQSANQHNADNY